MLVCPGHNVVRLGALGRLFRVLRLDFVHLIDHLGPDLLPPLHGLLEPPIVHFLALSEDVPDVDRLDVDPFYLHL